MAGTSPITSNPPLQNIESPATTLTLTPQPKLPPAVDKKESNQLQVNQSGEKRQSLKLQQQLKLAKLSDQQQLPTIDIGKLKKDLYSAKDA